MVRSWLPFLVVAHLVFSTSLAVADGSAKVVEFPIVNLPANVRDIAVEPDSGAVAISFPSSNSVSLYGPLLKQVEPVATFKAAGPPDFIAWTRFGGKPLLIVKIDKSRNIEVLDAKLKSVGSITCQFIPRQQLAVANGESRYVYYTYSGDDRGSGGGMRRIDLKTMKDAAAVEIMGRGDAEWIALSPNGKYLYSHRVSSSPTGIYAWAIEEREGAPPRLTNLKDEHDSAAGYICDVDSRFVANSKGVWSADMSRLETRTNGVPIGFLRGSPYYCFLQSFHAYDKVELRIASLNSGSVVSAVNVPMRPPRDLGDLMGRGRGMNAALDSTGKAVIAAFGPSAVVIPLDQVADLEEPDLSLNVADVPPIALGDTLRLQIRPRTAGTTVELQGAPEGMKLAGDQITWKPGTDQIGRHEVTLLLEKGPARRTEVLTISTRRSLGSLPFNAAMSRLTPDGSKLIVMNQTETNARNSGRNNPTELAVVETATGKLLARKQSDSYINQFTVNDQFVLCVHQEKSQVRLLKLSDLSVADERVTSGRPATVGLTKDLAILLTQTGNSLDAAAYRLSDKAAVTNFAGNGTVQSSALGLWVGDVLLDPATYRPICVVNFGSIPWFQSGNAQRQRRSREPRFNSPAIRELMHPAFDKPARAAVLESAPVLVRIDVEQKREAGGRERPRPSAMVSLAVAPIDAPDKAQKIPLAELSQQMHGFEYWCGLHVQQESQGRVRVVAVFYDQFALLDLSDTVKGVNASVPPYVQKIEPLVSIPADKSTEVRATFAGGNGPLRYELASQVDGVTVNEKTGAVTVDAPSIVPRAATQLAATVRPGMTSSDAFGDATKAFKRLSEKDAKGIPIFVGVDITAIDSRDNRATLSRGVIIEIPTASIDKAVAERPAQAVVGGAGVDERLIRLERENAALRAENKTLRELLKMPTTNPSP